MCQIHISFKPIRGNLLFNISRMKNRHIQNTADCERFNKQEIAIKLTFGRYL